MEHNRLVELAIKGLEAQRARIDQELAALRSLGRGSQTSASTSKAIDAKSAAPRRRVMSAAARKKISEAMKRSHAERKAAAKK
jgi:hypothetical protein